jgi:hypothetical protein
MVVSVGQPLSPLVHRLACFIIVWPPDKRVVTQGGGGHLIAAVSYRGRIVVVA